MGPNAYHHHIPASIGVKHALIHSFQTHSIRSDHIMATKAGFKEVSSCIMVWCRIAALGLSPHRAVRVGGIPLGGDAFHYSRPGIGGI